MIVHSTNILAAPLMVVVWAIDIYVFMASIRLVFSKIAAAWSERIATGLKPFTDPIPVAIQQHLARRNAKPPPTWRGTWPAHSGRHASGTLPPDRPLRRPRWSWRQSGLGANRPFAVCPLDLWGNIRLRPQGEMPVSVVLS